MGSAHSSTKSSREQRKSPGKLLYTYFYELLDDCTNVKWLNSYSDYSFGNLKEKLLLKLCREKLSVDAHGKVWKAICTVTASVRGNLRMLQTITGLFQSAFDMQYEDYFNVTSNKRPHFYNVVLIYYEDNKIQIYDDTYDEAIGRGFFECTVYPCFVFFIRGEW